MARSSRRSLALLVLSTSLGVVAVVGDGARPAVAAVDPDVDFDGDGRGDLVVPVVGESVGSKADAGAVHVIYGSVNGLGTTRTQLWHQDSTGIREEAEAGDRFGAAWAAGDFDGDGYDDLAIGVPGEDGGAGLVNVLYGGANRGLAAQGNQIWWQDKTDVPGTSAALDGYGTALVAGDFDDDGRDDLVIGAPVDAADGTSGARGGTVNVVYGSSAGLITDSAKIISQNSTDVLGDAEVGDAFGYSLASGDINGDGRDDVAVGAPYEDYKGADSGSVSVFFGVPSGLANLDSQTLLQGERGLMQTSEAGDTFGAAVEIGRFDYGPYADLVIGIPGQTVSGAPDAGALMTVTGGATGLRVGRAALWHMGQEAVAGPLRGSVLFGDVLERADFDGDGRDDLVIGVWGFDRNGVSNVGAIITLYGGTAMFGGAIPSILVTQDSANVVDVAETNDSFGQYLAAVDGNGDGEDGLFVGVPLEDFGTVTDAGAGHVFGGGGFGLVPTSSTLWTQDLDGIGDTAESGDLFGGAGVL